MACNGTRLSSFLDYVGIRHMHVASIFYNDTGKAGVSDEVISPDKQLNARASQTEREPWALMEVTHLWVRFF